MNYNVMKHTFCDEEDTYDKERCTETLEKYYSDQSYNEQFIELFPYPEAYFVSIDLDCSDLNYYNATMLLYKLEDIYPVDISEPYMICKLCKTITRILFQLKLEYSLSSDKQVQYFVDQFYNGVNQETGFIVKPTAIMRSYIEKLLRSV